MTYTQVWFQWDAPRNLVARGFAAAAAFYRAVPWQNFESNTIIRAATPGGRQWKLVIHGDEGEPGMSAYPAHDDESPDENDTNEDDGARCISLTFGVKELMPEEVRREIREQGWEVVGPAAYPRFYDLFSKGRDFTLGELEEVITLVEAVPRYVNARQRFLSGEGVLARRRNLLTQVCWTDDSSGVQFEDGISDA